MGGMRIGIGLPAAVPGAPHTALGDWAAEAARLGFESVAAIDRLVYDNLDPLVALAAAAARTERMELLTTILGVPYRRNPVALAKQIASVDLLSGGRLTVGMGLGGWPEDYEASDVPLAGRGATFEAMLAGMRAVWDGELAGAGGPMPALPAGRPGILLGGLVPASFERVAAHADGWLAPAFGLDTLRDGAAAARRAWAEGGRPGRPRIATLRYFSLGDAAEEIAEEYLAHYYGAEYVSAAMADTATTPEDLRDELSALSAAGCDDVLLFPCSGALEQVELLAEAVGQVGAVDAVGAAPR
jgi:alkanesulfonate monooxygenase SsuD/methylene tetrahydromethanopterin reductase-like flavin-dependent oxidoreductase (luciferase family)